MKRLNLDLPEDEHAELKAFAARQHTSIKELVSTWIREKMGAADTPEQGRKQGVVYPQGGLPASTLADR